MSTYIRYTLTIKTVDMTAGGLEYMSSTPTTCSSEDLPPLHNQERESEFLAQNKYNCLHLKTQLVHVEGVNPPS